MKVEISKQEAEILLAYIDHAVKTGGIAQATNGLILYKKFEAVLPKEKPEPKEK